MGVGAAAIGAQSFDTTSWKQPFEPFRIIGNIHYVGTSELGAFLITTPEGHSLLDGLKGLRYNGTDAVAVRPRRLKPVARSARSP